MATLLRKIYYNPKAAGGFGSIEALSKASKTKRKKTKTWLEKQLPYTLHRPIRRKFQRRRIVVGGIDHQWQADLADVANLSKENNGYKFLLTCIDVLSKFAWVVPLKDKTGKTLVKAFTRIFKQKPQRTPLALQTDKGSEFVNKVFQKFLTLHNVHFFTTENQEIKASIVERFNRTLKTKMWRYFTHTNKYRYVDVLQDLVAAYNASKHRSIGMAPEDVDETNEEKVWQKLYSRSKAERRQTTPGGGGVRRRGRVGVSGVDLLRVGDKVRISKAKRLFDKGYLPNWTEEIFEIASVVHTIPKVYKLRDYDGAVITGTFYTEELQKVSEPDLYRVETILKQRKRKGRSEYFVKWLGYPTSFNSWVTDLEKISVG